MQMNKKLVFISLPLSGRKEEDILEDIRKAKKAYLTINNEDICDIAFINNHERGKTAVEYERFLASEEGCNWVEPMRMSVWYLGIAMQNLADCDAAIFYGDWKNARGCRIERMVCQEYDIPVIELHSAPGRVYIDIDI